MNKWKEKRQKTTILFLVHTELNNKKTSQHKKTLDDDEPK